MAVINDFSTNYMKALGLNQAYILLKLRNNYYIVLICSFGSITGNIHITALDNNFIRFFFICITRMISDDTENYMDTENAMSINKKNHINIKCSLLNKTMHFIMTEIFLIKL